MSVTRTPPTVRSMTSTEVARSGDPATTGCPRSARNRCAGRSSPASTSSSVVARSSWRTPAVSALQSAPQVTPAVHASIAQRRRRGRDHCGSSRRGGAWDARGASGQWPVVSEQWRYTRRNGMTGRYSVIEIMDRFPKKPQGACESGACLYWRSAASATLAIRLRKGWAAVVAAAAAEGLRQVQRENQSCRLLAMGPPRRMKELCKDASIWRTSW
jgi:hypothetical protein